MLIVSSYADRHTVRIEMSKADCVMNSKSEFHQAPLVRVVPVNGLVEEQGAGVDPRQPGGGGRGGPRSDFFLRHWDD